MNFQESFGDSTDRMPETVGEAMDQIMAHFERTEGETSKQENRYADDGRTWVKDPATRRLSAAGHYEVKGDGRISICYSPYFSTTLFASEADKKLAVGDVNVISKELSIIRGALRDIRVGGY